MRDIVLVLSFHESMVECGYGEQNAIRKAKSEPLNPLEKFVSDVLKDNITVRL